MKARYQTLTLVIGFALTVLLSSFAAAQAQSGTQSQTEPGAPQQPQAQPQAQANQADQMLGFLNLTQDQVRKIRMINVELREERQEANLRLRLANRALQEAIQSPTPDETLISQRSKEFADAQANTIRLRSLTEARILQVLTPEQRVKLREFRMQQASRNQNQRRNGNQFPRALQRPQSGLQRNSNSAAPMTPRQQRKANRQQQQQPTPQPTRP
jgi:Spy/CpxP family protein refolding chaperone